MTTSGTQFPVRFLATVIIVVVVLLTPKQGRVY